MDKLKTALQLQAKLANAETAFVSLANLTIGKKYLINDISKVQTMYGLRILVSLLGDNKRLLKTYLPKSIKLSDEYIELFNTNHVLDRKSHLHLVYKGKNNNGSYKIDFE